jgi:hypothetical protein
LRLRVQQLLTAIAIVFSTALFAQTKDSKDKDPFEVEDAGSVQSFDNFSAEFIRDFASRTSMLTSSITQHAGLPLYRLMTTIPAGRNWAVIRVDVEGINIRDRYQGFENLLENHKPSEIIWRNLFLIWNSQFPDTEGVDIGRLRDLGIFLQNMDVNGEWNYATLRQKVHNFPSPSIVEDLKAEIQKAHTDFETVSPTLRARRELLQRRLALLEELKNLEERFWFGQGIDSNYVRGILKTYDLDQEFSDLYFDDQSPILERVEKMTSIREKMRKSIGSDGLSIQAMMSSDKILGPSQRLTFISFLSFERKLANESQRLLSKVHPKEIQQDPAKHIGLIARLLALDGLITDYTKNEVIQLAKDPAANQEAIRSALMQPVTELQGHFTALRNHLMDLLPKARAEAEANPRGERRDALIEQLDSYGNPARLVELGDNEVRQSLLFATGNLVQQAFRAISPNLKWLKNGKEEALPETEIILPLKGPAYGQILVIRNQTDVHRATAYAEHGQPVILLKLVHYDIELPPAALLVTADPALNQASHMALLAKSAGIGHLNILGHQSGLMDWLIKNEGKQVRIGFDGTDAGILRVTNVDVDDASNQTSHHALVRLENNISEDYSKALPLSKLIQEENRIGKNLSGGKGRGLALIEEVIRSDPKKYSAIRIPAGVQIPYGLFMTWFKEIDLLTEWNKALQARPNSVHWNRVIEEVERRTIPPQMLDQIIEAMGGPQALKEGWFVRSNSNSEDGGFNGAGINRTIADVRTRQEFESAVKQVFLATYLPNARAWWHRIFENPADVRASVKLTKTVVATHSSVSIVSDGGKIFTADSLPGVGENVVGGSGIAERLVYKLNSDGSVSEIILTQPSSAYQLRMWSEDENGERHIERKTVIQQGHVLNRDQRKAAYDLIRQVREAADRTEFKGKPLDLELSWRNKIPYLVQIRVAPQNPVSKAVRNLPAQVQQEGADTTPVTLHDISIGALAELIAKELKQPGRISTATQAKVGLLSNMIRLANVAGRTNEAILERAGAADILPLIREKAAFILEEMAEGKMEYKEVEIQKKAILDINELVQIEGNRSANSLFIDQPHLQERASKALQKYLEKNANQIHVFTGMAIFNELMTGQTDYNYSGYGLQTLSESRRNAFTHAFLNIPSERLELLAEQSSKLAATRELETHPRFINAAIKQRITELFEQIEKSQGDHKTEAISLIKEIKGLMNNSKFFKGRDTDDSLFVHLRRLFWNRLSNDYNSVTLVQSYQRLIESMSEQTGLPFESEGYRNDESRPHEKSLESAALRDDEIFLSLLRMRSDFQEHMTKSELARPAQWRSLDRMLGLLQNETDSERRLALIYGLNEMGAKVTISPKRRDENSRENLRVLKICAGSATCSFFAGNEAGLNLTELLHFNSVETKLFPANDTPELLPTPRGSSERSENNALPSFDLVTARDFGTTLVLFELSRTPVDWSGTLDQKAIQFWDAAGKLIQHRIKNFSKQPVKLDAWLHLRNIYESIRQDDKFSSYDRDDAATIQRKREIQKALRSTRVLTGLNKLLGMNAPTSEDLKVSTHFGNAFNGREDSEGEVVVNVTWEGGNALHLRYLLQGDFFTLVSTSGSDRITLARGAISKASEILASLDQRLGGKLLPALGFDSPFEACLRSLKDVAIKPFQIQK